MAGGKTPYQKGAAFERKVQKLLEEDGWLVVRQPKSQSPFDLIAFDGDGWGLLIQCKLAGYMSPKERTELFDVASRYSMEAILATPEGFFTWSEYLNGKGAWNLYMYKGLERTLSASRTV